MIETTLTRLKGSNNIVRLSGANTVSSFLNFRLYDVVTSLPRLSAGFIRVLLWLYRLLQAVKDLISKKASAVEVAPLLLTRCLPVGKLCERKPGTMACRALRAFVCADTWLT